MDAFFINKKASIIDRQKTFLTYDICSPASSFCADFKNIKISTFRIS